MQQRKEARRVRPNRHKAAGRTLAFGAMQRVVLRGGDVLKKGARGGGSAGNRRGLTRRPCGGRSFKVQLAIEACEFGVETREWRGRVR
jgi:hypothetical protein